MSRKQGRTNRRMGHVLAAFLCAISGVTRAQVEKGDVQTCRDLAQDRSSRDSRIERLESELEEYRLVDGNRIKVVEDECGQFDACPGCLRVESDLNCGWCFLHSRCTLKGNCPGTEPDSGSWIGQGGLGCPRIRKITPQQIPSFQPTWLDVQIPHLPPYDGVFVCSFQVLGKTFISKAERTDDGVKCWSQHDAKLPGESKFAPVAVSVRTPNGANFVSTTNFTIYDCGRYQSCSECASSPFPCSWCLGSNRCTHDVNENCKNDIIVGSAAISRPRIRKGRDFCAKIVSNSPEGTEILVPVGLKKMIHVKTENIVNFIATSRLVCAIHGHPRADAQILGDSIYCQSIQFRNIDRNPLSNLSLNVMWNNGDTKLDNPHNIHVLVFDCSMMATSCGTCLELPERYNCGWCEDAGSCMVHDSCRSPVWLDRGQRCTKPEIMSFHPKAALINRPTNVTIHGVNFGRHPSDIHVRLVNEGGETMAECDPYEDHVTSIKIVCFLDIPETSSSEGNDTSSGFFEILLWNQFVAVSNEDFTFVDPGITAISPVKGTKSGGTLIEIQGRHLDAGGKVVVTIADIPCKIVSRDASTIRCITSPSKRTLSSAVQVAFDGVQKTSPGYYYYVEDPWVKLVRSESYRDGPIGTPSGGSLIIVEGDNFDHVLNPPYVYIIVENKEYIGACSVESPTEMKCLSPRVPSEKLSFCGRDGFLSLEYGFKMDDVADVQNISLQAGFARFHMFADPFFLPFKDEGKIKVFKSDYLAINGWNMDRGHNDEDIIVEIGVGKCAVTSLSHSQLTCRPPNTQPPARDGNPEKLPEVVVKVSETLEFFIGYLRYVS